MNNFKRAIRTTVIFLVVLITLSACIMEVFFAGENYYYQDYREREALSGNLDYIVCGASHAMRGFKPDVIDEKLGVNSYNLSCSRMTMQGRYELLKLELERNPVKTLVMELSYDSLTRDRDEEGPEGDIYLLGKLDSFGSRMKYFFSAVRLKDYGRMYYNYIDNGINCLKKVIRGTWTDKNEKLSKGYAAYKRENTDLNERLDKIYRTHTFSEKICDENMEYFQKIIDLCNENDIELVMVTTPLSKVTVCRYGNLDVFREYYQDIAAENGLVYYDFNLLKCKEEKLPDSSAFFDKFHLGNEGAQTFTELFTEVMQMKDMGQDTDPLFYESYEELDAHMDFTNN